MYLSYLDDGGQRPFRVFGGVVMEDKSFKHIESRSAMVALALMDDARRESFTEFHASHLANATGIFEGLPRDQCHDALRGLIRAKNEEGLPFIYCAVNMPVLEREPIRSASWADIAFSMCALTIDEHVRTTWEANYIEAMRVAQAYRAPVDLGFGKPGIGVPPMLHMMILDEPEKERDKFKIKRSFRVHRDVMVRASKREASGFSYSSRLITSVDDLFFGSSADSVGLQIADVCNWVMWRHLIGQDESDFYKELMRGDVRCAKPEPEWSRYRHLLKAHDE